MNARFHEHCSVLLNRGFGSVRWVPKIVDHEQRRRDITDALWRVVDRDGFGAVSVRSVAAEAGLKPTTVALAFESRTHLLVQAYSELSGREEARLARLAKRGMSVDVLVESALLGIPLTAARVRHTSVWIALIDAAGHDAVAAAALVEFNDRVAQRIGAYLQLAVDEGILRPDLNVGSQVLLIHALIDGFSVQIQGTAAPKRAAIAGVFRDYFGSLQP